VFVYRLSKYDPAKRNAAGVYLPKEWTSVSDIGRTFDGQTVSVSDYVEIEDAYVDAVRTLLLASGITSMSVADLELRLPERQVHLTDAVLESCRRVRDNHVVSGAGLDAITRACLREYLWCRLEGPGGAYVHFGYDFFVYVGVPKSANGSSLPRAVFLEECESPYISLDD
jgi:hypothetical protein